MDERNGIEETVETPSNQPEQPEAGTTEGPAVEEKPWKEPVHSARFAAMKECAETLGESMWKEITKRNKRIVKRLAPLLVEKMSGKRLTIKAMSEALTECLEHIHVRLL
jgi:hypothetical protein